ncbi:MAG: hypothetical protein VW268_11235 [Rhodospirillaceae bacterium]
MIDRPASAGHHGRKFRACLAALSVVTTATACAPTGRIDDFDRIMAALGPSPLFAGLEDRRDWMTVGRPASGQVAMAVDEGMPVVKIDAGPDDLILGRRIDQHLLATPYLTWAWKMSPHGGLYHPIRVIVGFRDGPTPAGRRDAALTEIPRGVRVLEMVWNEKALRRGVLEPPGAEGRTPARYTIRGGEEALGKRWTEGVDLISLHDSAWPGVSTSDTRILFVSVRAAPYAPVGPRPVALISDIRLIR